MTDPAQQGLAALDRALADRPRKNGQALTDATRALCDLRETLIAHVRATGGRQGQPQGEAARRRLEHLNAVLSLIAAVHFPLGDTPWDELEKARGWLTELMEPGI